MGFFAIRSVPYFYAVPEFPSFRGLQVGPTISILVSKGGSGGGF